MKCTVPCRGVLRPIGAVGRGAICRRGSNYNYKRVSYRLPVRTVRGITCASLSDSNETVEGEGEEGITDLAKTISHEQHRSDLQVSQEIFVPSPAQPSQTSSALQGAVIGFAVAASVFSLGKRTRRRLKSPEKAPGAVALDRMEETERETSLISSLATDLDISGTERLREMQKVTAMTRSLARPSLERSSDHDAKPEHAADLSIESESLPVPKSMSTSTQEPAGAKDPEAAAPRNANKQKRSESTVLEEAAKDSEDELETKSSSLPRLKSDDCEPVDWVNMWIRKVWMIYQKGLERWIMNTLQPPIDYIGKPAYIKRVLIKEIILGNNPIVFSNMRRASSRQVNDLQYQVDARYAGNIRVLLEVELGIDQFSIKVPVALHDLDLQAELWVKVRLAPRSPFIDTISVAFVKLPSIRFELAPFRQVRLMNVPVLNNFLRQLLMQDLPAKYVFPRRIDFALRREDDSENNPSGTVQGFSDTGHKTPVILSPAYEGEVQVTLVEGRNLPSGGIANLSNPYCVLSLGSQLAESRRNNLISIAGNRGNPVWNQDFHFLVEDSSIQRLVVHVRDSPMTFRTFVGGGQLPLSELQDGRPLDTWIPITDGFQAYGDIRLRLVYKKFIENDTLPEDPEADDYDDTEYGFSERADAEDLMYLLPCWPELPLPLSLALEAGALRGKSGYKLNNMLVDFNEVYSTSAESEQVISWKPLRPVLAAAAVTTIAFLYHIVFIYPNVH